MKKLILSAAFLGLGVFGFAQTIEGGKASFEQRKADHLQKMKQELNLTDTQVAQLNPNSAIEKK